jgi:uncharacterized protein YcfJ
MTTISKSLTAAAPGPRPHAAHGPCQRSQRHVRPQVLQQGGEEARQTRRPDKKVFTHMVAGGVVGGLLGNALGGKKTTVGFAAGGAALGMIDGASKWDMYYANAYESCMEDMED